MAIEQVLLQRHPHTNVMVRGTGLERAILAVPYKNLFCLAFAPDSKTLATGHYEGNVRLWDIATATERKGFVGDNEEVTSVAFAPKAPIVAAGQYQTIHLWNVATGQPIATFQGHSDRVNSLAFSPDGKWLASAGDWSVVVWSLSEGQQHLTIKDEAEVQCVAWAPKGASIVSGGEGLALWDPYTGAKQATLAGHTDTISSLAFSADGKTLASSSDDGTIRLWDITTRHWRAAFEIGGLFHRRSFAALDSKGRWLAAVVVDGEIMLWKTSDFHVYFRFKGHIQRGGCAAFSPDGKILASGSDLDGTAKLWDLSELVKRKSVDPHAFQPIEQPKPLAPAALKEKPTFSPDDVDSIFAAICAEIARFARKHRKETFYAFAFDACLLCFNSEEHFARSLKKYQKDKDWGEKYKKPAGIRSLRYNTGDWKYQGFGDLPIDGSVYEKHYGLSDHKQRTSTYRKMIDKLIRRLKANRKAVFDGLRLTKDFRIFYAEHIY